MSKFNPNPIAISNTIVNKQTVSNPAYQNDIIAILPTTLTATKTLTYPDYLLALNFILFITPGATAFNLSIGPDTIDNARFIQDCLGLTSQGSSCLLKISTTAGITTICPYYIK